MIDAPQAYVTAIAPIRLERTSTGRAGRPWLRSPQTHQQTEPQQRQRETVRQQLMIDVDESEESDQEPG